MDLEWFERAKVKIKSTITKYGFGSLAEDCCQDYAVSLLEGKAQHQTINQYVIDYLRKNLGRKSYQSFDQKRNLSRANSYESYGYDNTTQGSDGSEMERKIDFHKVISLVEHKDKEVAKLYYIEGLNEKELANLSSLSVSIIYRKIKRIRKRLSMLIEEESRCYEEGRIGA